MAVLISIKKSVCGRARRRNRYREERVYFCCSGAFKNCKNLELIELTGSIKKIYKNAFKGIAKNAKFVIRASEEDFARIVELVKKSGVDDSVTFERAE